MKRKLNKIISITIAIIMILSSPLGSYLQGDNAKAYALDLTIDNAIKKYAIPVVAYMSWQYENTMKGIENVVATVSDINAQISKIENVKQDLISLMPIASKAILANLYTNLTVDDINVALGSNYTIEQINSMTLPYRNKIDNGTIGSYDDIFGLGISHLFANSVKFLNNNLFDDTINLPIQNLNTIDYKIKEFIQGSYVKSITFENKNFNYEFLNLLGSVIVVSTLYMFNADSGLPALNNVSTYTFSNYRIVNNIYSKQVWPSSSENWKFKDIILNTNFLNQHYPSLYGNISIQFFNGSTWSTLKTYSQNSALFLSALSAKTFIDDLLTYTGYNLSDSIFYNTDYHLNDLFNYTFIGDTVINPSGSISLPLSIPKVGSGYFAPDTTISNAERLISSIGTTTGTYDLDIGTKTVANDNPDTNISNPVITDILVHDRTDGSTVPDVNTNPNGDGEIGNPDDTDGILGWLKGLWNILKGLWASLLAFLASIVALLQSIFTNTGNISQSSEGIDWGNFKGFFDIFYIFYYLIIIVILILLKFLVTVFNMISIPANTALFDQYPTMLAGINYLKNLKIGGFNITFQQILEYMFTIFFFLFIVTVLQKLYHSFAGIERQTVKQQENWTDNKNIFYDESRDYAVDKRTGEIQDYKYK